MLRRASLPLALLLAACGPSAAPPAPAGGGRADVRAEDLRARLEAFAHDSMMGREAGKAGNAMATRYLAEQVRALGLEPAGDDGTYFQTVPMIQVAADPGTLLDVEGVRLRFGDDLLPVAPYPGVFPFGYGFDLAEAEVVFVGWPAAESAPREDVRGRVVVIAPSGPMTSPPDFGGWAARYADAGLLIIAGLEGFPPPVRAFLEAPRVVLSSDAEAQGPPTAFATGPAVARLLGAAPSQVRVGPTGRRATGRGGVSRTEPEAPARNVVAVLRGTDPNLRDEYVALGAHNDHVGTGAPLDHDSLRASNLVLRPEGAETVEREPTPAERTRIAAMRDSLRRSPPNGADSIFNGADDDGSGSVALLELAERFALGERPRRSLLFVWHTAEEAGLLGSQWFTDHPTVDRAAIVAQLNIDMIARGMAADVPGGGMGYLQLVGSRRLSTELGDLVESVNRDRRLGFRFDYAYDADGHPQNIYCRSDHASYARYGIPVVFFTTGVHSDYHQLTDDAAYVNYPKLAKVTSFVGDIAEAVANLDHRVRVDGPVPADPRAPCVQ